MRKNYQVSARQKSSICTGKNNRTAASSVRGQSFAPVFWGSDLIVAGFAMFIKTEIAQVSATVVLGFLPCRCFANSTRPCRVLLGTSVAMNRFASLLSVFLQPCFRYTRPTLKDCHAVQRVFMCLLLPCNLRFFYTLLSTALCHAPTLAKLSQGSTAAFVPEKTTVRLHAVSVARALLRFSGAQT